MNAKTSAFLSFLFKISKNWLRRARNGRGTPRKSSKTFPGVARVPGSPAHFEFWLYDCYRVIWSRKLKMYPFFGGEYRIWRGPKFEQILGFQHRLWRSRESCRNIAHVTLATEKGYPGPVKSSALQMKIIRHLDSKIKVNTSMYKNSQKSPFFGNGAHSIFLQKMGTFSICDFIILVAIAQSKFEVCWTPRDSRNPRNVFELFPGVPRPFRGLRSHFCCWNFEKKT